MTSPLVNIGTVLVQAMPWQQIFFPNNHERRSKVEEELLRLARESSSSPSSSPVVEEEVFVPPSSPVSPQEAVTLPPPPTPSVSGFSQVAAGGKACSVCGADHFSTAAGLLEEAPRFARKGGLEDPEVIRRVDKVFRELNAFEREDGAPENIVKLPEDEKVVMRALMDRSRDLRHQLTDMKSLDDLEAVAAHAGEVSLKSRTQVFKMRLRRAREEAAATPSTPSPDRSPDKPR